MQFSTENTYRRLTRNNFQAFIHSPHAMVLAAEYDDLTLAYRSHAWDWDVVGWLANPGLRARPMPVAG